MKTFYFLSVSFFLLTPYQSFAFKSIKETSACKSFEAGKIDAYQTLEALDLDLNNFSIGVNNTAKIFCT